MLPDQVPGSGEGAWLPFFGRPAYTMTLAARLSEWPASPRSSPGPSACPAAPASTCTCARR
jgi:hypothetical protein